MDSKTYINLMATITITGLDEILGRPGYRRNLDLSIPLDESLALLHRTISNYPPQRPTNYKRTGNLGRSWTSEIKRKSLATLEGKVGTKIKYAPYVQGAGTQARIHRHHWQTDQDVLDQEEDEIRRIFRDYVINSVT